LMTGCLTIVFLDHCLLSQIEHLISSVDTRPHFVLTQIRKLHRN
jgi:hypothetical protein